VEEKMKRTRFDFSKHDLTVKHCDCTVIYHLAKPNTIVDSVKFINTNGILAVTGDYGNWIFCREFHPKENGSVSDGYWMEKLQIASTQKPEEYDSDATRAEIQRRLADNEDPPTDEEKEYYESLLRCVDDEFEYTCAAYNDKPSDMDWEYIPMIRKTKYWLEVVFDAFEEICSRLKEDSCSTK
jgi:hypothetical protein